MTGIHWPLMGGLLHLVTASRGLGGLRPLPVQSSLYQKYQPTRQRPVYQLHIIRCGTVSDIPSRRHLRSAARHHLTVPRYRLSTFGRRAFSVAGPTVWNSLPDSLRDPALSSNSFRQSLKTNLFRRYQHTQRSGDAS